MANGAQPPGRKPIEEATAVRAEKVVKAFNTWAYKREQPSCAKRLHAVVEHAVAAARAIPFVLYWGKGPRSEVATPDLVCLDYLTGMAGRIRDAYGVGAAMRLILTDTHAELNGHSAGAIDAYFGSVSAAAAARGFETVRLSRLVAEAHDTIDLDADATPSGYVLDSLTSCAAKWYRGGGSMERGAMEYYRMNMVEKRAVEAAYPYAVFVTFNGAEFRELFPTTMPIFYMYSLRRGMGVKPWFMPADDAPSSASESAPDFVTAAA